MSSAFAALLGALALLGAAPLDPTRVHTFSVDAARTPSRTSELLLPRSAGAALRVNVPGGIAHAPSVTRAGAIYVAHAQPTLSRYSAAGRLEWTLRLGTSRSVASPITLADGNALVLTDAAEALLVSERGTLLWRRHLPMAALSRTPSIGTLADGGVLIAAGKRLVRLDGAGSLVHSTLLDDEALFILGSPGTPLVIDSAGHIRSVASDGKLTVRGRLEGRVDAVARAGASRIVALVEGRRLVELDLGARSTRVRFADDTLLLGPALALNPAGESRVVAFPDLLLLFQSDGLERQRAQLPASFGAGVPSASELTLDGEGTTLLVRPGVDASIVLADGSVLRVDGTACPEPLRPVALPRRSAVLTCRSGLLTLVRERKT